MKNDFIEQLDGYRDVAREIDIARKYGRDYHLEAGRTRELVERLHPSRIETVVSHVLEETATTHTIRLSPKSGLMPPFQAGQYVTLFLEINGIVTSRPYSISSSPSQNGFYEITVRRVPHGLVSNYLLDNVNTGTPLTISGPSGTFVHNPLVHENEMVCIAGGSGVTPFISMVREITSRNLDRRVVLIYGSRELDDIIFHEELLHLSRSHQQLAYYPVIENPGAGYLGKTGLITSEQVLDIVGSIEGKSFFICGPQAMYEFCLPQLEALQISRKHLRREMYGAPANIWEFPGWPTGVKAHDTFEIRINGEATFSARAGTPLINSFEKNHIQVPTLCRSGECSMCRVKIVSGTVFQPPGVPVRQSDRQFGYTHACMSYPLSDLSVLL